MRGQRVKIQFLGFGTFDLPPRSPKHKSQRVTAAREMVQAASRPPVFGRTPAVCGGFEGTEHSPRAGVTAVLLESLPAQHPRHGAERTRLPGGTGAV